MLTTLLPETMATVVEEEEEEEGPEEDGARWTYCMYHYHPEEQGSRRLRSNCKFNSSTHPGVEGVTASSRRQHAGHHTKVLKTKGSFDKCRRIADFVEIAAVMEHEVLENNARVSMCDTYTIEGVNIIENMRQRQKSFIAEMKLAVNSDNATTVKNLCLSAAPETRKAIIQEATSEALRREKFNVLDHLIDISNEEENVEVQKSCDDNISKLPFTYAFRLCHDWSAVRTLVRYGLQCRRGSLLTRRRMCDPCGRTVLHLAVMHNDPDLCRDVIAAEPELVHARSGASDQTVLQVAVASGSIGTQCVGMLLEAGADPAQRSNEGRTAVAEAAICGNAVAIRQMVAAARSGGMTAAAKVLVTLPDCAGLTPLHHAVARGFHLCVEVLLAAGASINPTSVSDPSLYSPISCTEDMNEENSGLPVAGGQTTPLLIMAVQGGHAEIVKLLLNAGCDPSHRDVAPGWAALHYTVSEYPEPSCLHALLINCSSARNLDPNVLTADGRTALMLAVTFGQCDMVGKLLKHPACNVNIRDTGSGMSALHRAADAGCHLCTATLLAAGAEPDRPDADGASPLLLAVNSRHTHLMSELLTWGRGWWPWAELNKCETSVLDIVLKRGYWDIAQFLLIAGWELQAFHRCLSRGKSGHMQICVPNSFRSQLTTAPALKHLCRLRFKVCLGLRAPPEINCLPFPVSIKSYLLFEDLASAVLHPPEQ